MADKEFFKYAAEGNLIVGWSLLGKLGKPFIPIGSPLLTELNLFGSKTIGHTITELLQLAVTMVSDRHISNLTQPMKKLKLNDKGCNH